MNPQPKYKPAHSINLTLNKADFQLLPSPADVNRMDWLRSAIRLLAAVEAAGLDAETIVKEMQKKASK